MPSEKIEGRLLEEIRQFELAGQPDRRIPVLIQVEVEPWDTPQEGRLDYAQLEGRVRSQQGPVRQRLAELGVTTEIRPLILSNSLEARLTPAQIRQMGQHQDVRLIILNREEQVTA